MKAVRAAAWLVIAYLAVHTLIMVQDLLIPLVLAIFFWFLINNLRHFFGRLELSGRRLPRWASFVAALGLIALGVFGLVDLVETNVSRVAEEGQVYQRNAEARIAEIFAGLGLDEPPALPELMKRVDLEVVVSRSATAIASNPTSLPSLTR